MQLVSGTIWFPFSRSSLPEVFYEECVFKISQNSQENASIRDSVSIKLQGSILKNTSFYKTPLVSASAFIDPYRKV